jgi:hypothetical protein
VGLQINYSLLERTVERELIPVAKDQGMTVVAWSPLHNGLLTGKYLPEKNSAGSQGTRLDSEMMKSFASVDKSGLVEMDEPGFAPSARSSLSAKNWAFLPHRWPLHGFVTARSRSSRLSGHANCLSWKTT